MIAHEIRVRFTLGLPRSMSHKSCGNANIAIWLEFQSASHRKRDMRVPVVCSARFRFQAFRCRTAFFGFSFSLRLNADYVASRNQRANDTNWHGLRTIAFHQRMTWQQVGFVPDWQEENECL